LGLGFRAFEFARAARDRMAVRVYGGAPWRAIVSLPKLWRGERIEENDHRFLLTRCRFEFDRPVPYEIGGDLAGMRDAIEFSARPAAVQLVDFRALRESRTSTPSRLASSKKEGR
jgi:hypothetical protein